MDPAGRLLLDLNETFPPLAHAPIVEAVIAWRARAGVLLENDAFRHALGQQLPDYPILKDLSLQRVRLQFAESVQESRSDTWTGIRAESADKLHIAQLTRDGLLFSRLQPYQSWQQFRTEAIRVWRVYETIARPLEISRLAVRFINRISIATDDLQGEKVLQTPPQPPRGLALNLHSYLHQDTWTVPGYPYTVIIRKTIQTPRESAMGEAGLILDIDAFTVEAFAVNEALTENRLAQMRWLKNKVFFSSITPEALEMFQNGAKAGVS